MTIWDVVVVGAGLSGLTAAQSLTQAGYTVLVLDKSRGLGGRVATRRVGEIPVDHGCRFLQPFTQVDSTLIADGLAAGWLSPWAPLEFDLSNGNRLIPRSPTGPYYVAPGGMSSLAKALAPELTIQRQCRVVEVKPVATGWHLQAEPSPAGPSSFTARSLILAMPAPQISPLLTKAAESSAEICAWLAPITQVAFDAVITVMAGYSLSTVPDLDNFSAISTGWMVFGNQHPYLRWAALDSSKRLNPSRPVVVLHSSTEFATTHLESQDLQPVGARLLHQAGAILGLWLTEPAWMQVHRWRYGLVNQPLQTQTLYHVTLPSLVACGDWCRGAGVEDAISSGRAAAAQIAQWLN
jgi:hypothetical protein